MLMEIIITLHVIHNIIFEIYIYYNFIQLRFLMLLFYKNPLKNCTNQNLGTKIFIELLPSLGISLSGMIGIVKCPVYVDLKIEQLCQLSPF